MGYWIGILQPLTAVAGWTTASAALTGISFELCLAAVLPSIILVLYGFALAGLLSEGTALLVYGGNILLLPALFLLRRKGALRRLIATPASCAVLLLVILFCWHFRDGSFHIWDEFSFWGISSREMLANASLRDASSCIGYCLNYPQATDLLHYFFLRGGGDFEFLCYLGNFAIILSQGIPLLAGSGARRAPAFAAGVAILASLTSGFGLGFYSMCVDIALGMTFGRAAAGMFLARGASDLALALPSLALLPLIKLAGTLLALCCALLAFFPLRSMMRRGHSRTRRTVVILAVLIVALPSAAKLSWDRYVRDTGLEDSTFNLAPITFPRIVGAFSESASERQKQTSANFARALLKTPVGGLEAETAERFHATNSPLFRGLQLALWIAFVAALFYHAHRRAGAGEFSPWASALFFAFWGVFLAGMLVLYLFAFDDEEGPALAGYARYMSIWLTGALFVAGALLMETSRTGLAVLSVALLLTSPPNPEMYETERLPLRLELEPEVRFMRSVRPPGSSVYIVWEGSDGFERVVTKYELFPVRTNWENWNGEPDAAAWGRELVGYDFVFLGNAREALRAKYASLFAPGATSSDYFFSVRREAGPLLFPLRPNEQGAGRP